MKNRTESNDNIEAITNIVRSTYAKHLERAGLTEDVLPFQTVAKVVIEWLITFQSPLRMDLATAFTCIAAVN